MAKWLKVILLVAGAVVYLNIGYLVAYSVDDTAQHTMVTEKIYNVIDFMGVMERASTKQFPRRTDVVLFYGLYSVIWPVLVLSSWIVNSVVLLWKIGVWLATGGFLKWLNLIEA